LVVRGLRKIAHRPLLKAVMTPPSAIGRFVVPLVVAIGVAFVSSARAESQSELSESSLVPIAISVALPVVLVAGVGSVVVTSVEASADGVAWIVESSVDGACGSVRFSGHAIGASAFAVGAVITVTAIGTGLLLSAAGRVIAFIPNEVGKSLMYNQRVSQ
jgi:hypothetical protein